MRKLGKILLFLFSLCGLALPIATAVALFVEHPFAHAMKDFILFHEWMQYVLFAYAAIVVIMFAVLLVVSIALPGKVRDMQFRKEKGSLLFTRQSLESAVRHSFAHVDGITDARVRVKVKKPAEKSRVFVRLSVTDGRHFVGLSEEVQALIQDMLLESLGITVQDIQVKIVQLQGNAPVPSSVPPIETVGREDA